MSTPSTALTPRTSGFDLSPQTFEQAMSFSKMLADSDLVPKDFKGKPGNCMIAMQWGSELGLKPLQALSNIAVVNGRAALWGDAVIALVRSSPLCEYVIETDDGNTATCRVKRRGESEQIRTFSMDDARAAGLLGKAGPWTQYQKRMRQMRARAFALRDVFPDVLRGMPIAEEVQDIPTERHMGMADVVEPATPAPAAAPEVWPDEAFKARLPKWQTAINNGSKHDEIIQFARTKGTLTAEQEATIRALQPQAVAATFAQVEQQLRAATDEDTLNVAAGLIETITDSAQQATLNALYETRMGELSA